jgi:cytosine/adenosine deaminase-related metal-dependent hydrolase
VNDAAVLRNVLVARPDSGLLETRSFVLSRHGKPADTYTIELKDHAVIPALVNAHDHLHLNGIPSLAANEPFSNSYAWAAAYQAHFEDDRVKQALALPGELRHWQGGLKNALCGATTVMHHDPAQPVFDQPGFPARTVRPYGWAHSLHWQYGPPVAHSFQCTPQDVGWFIHLAEGTDSIAARELRELQALECLEANTVLIHGVGLNDEDVSQIIARGASVVWCPASNLRVLGRTVDPQRLRLLFAAGHLTLGTDSRLSGARDLLDELRIAAQFSDFSARELLQLVTVDARRVLRAGPARDDVIIYRRSSSDPFQDLMRLTRHELRAVVRNGEPLIADLDFEEWFARRSVACVQVRLDGQPKLCAAAMLAPYGVPQSQLEPGLIL